MNGFTTGVSFWSKMFVIIKQPLKHFKRDLILHGTKIKIQISMFNNG